MRSIYNIVFKAMMFSFYYIDSRQLKSKVQNFNRHILNFVSRVDIANEANEIESSIVLNKFFTRFVLKNNYLFNFFNQYTRSIIYILIRLLFTYCFELSSSNKVFVLFINFYSIYLILFISRLFFLISLLILIYHCLYLTLNCFQFITNFILFITDLLICR